MSSLSRTTYYPDEQQELEGEWEDNSKGYFSGGENYCHSQSPSTQANSPLLKFADGNAQYAERNFCSVDSGFKLSKSVRSMEEAGESGGCGVRINLYRTHFNESAGNDGEEVDFQPKDISSPCANNFDGEVMQQAEIGLSEINIFPNKSASAGFSLAKKAAIIEAREEKISLLIKPCVASKRIVKVAS